MTAPEDPITPSSEAPASPKKSTPMGPMMPMMGFTPPPAPKGEPADPATMTPGDTIINGTSAYTYLGENKALDSESKVHELHEVMGESAMVFENPQIAKMAVEVLSAEPTTKAPRKPRKKATAPAAKKAPRKSASSRAKMHAREYQKEHGVSFYEALDAVRHVRTSDSPWLHTLGGIVPTEELLHRWENVSPKTALSVPLGQTGNETVWIDMTTDFHWAIAGRTGSGITYTAHEIAVSLAALYGPDRVQMAFLTAYGHPGGEHSLGGRKISQLPHVFMTAYGLQDDRTALLATFEKIEKIMDQRLEQSQSSERGNPRPDLFFFIEGLTYDLLFAVRDIVPTLRRMVTQGHEIGVHLILVNQQFDVAAHGSLLAHITGRICLAQSSEQASMFMIGMRTAVAKSMRQGQAYLQDSAHQRLPELLQVLHADPKEIEDLIAAMPPATRDVN